MDQYSAARARAEKRLAKRLGSQVEAMTTIFLKPEPRPVIHLPKPPKTNGRHNEIDVTVYINGKAYSSSFSANVLGNLMSTQLNDDYLKRLLLEMIGTKFGRTKAL